MSKKHEESWVETGIIDNIRLRYIIRHQKSDELTFIAQFEYNRDQKWTAILRWDNTHGEYHMDIVDVNGNKRKEKYYKTDSVNEQIEIAFTEMEKIQSFLLDPDSSKILEYFNKDWQSYINRLTNLKKEIISKDKSNLLLGVTHHSLSYKMDYIVIEAETPKLTITNK